MPSAGSITKTIRFSPEDREKVESLIESENLTWGGAIHKLISGQGTPQNGYQKTRGNTKSVYQGTPHDEIRDLRNRLQELRARCKGEKAEELFDSKLYSGIQIETIDEGTPRRQDLMDKAVEDDINQMCRLSGISTHDFYRGVSELWSAGKLEIEGEKVKSNGEYDVKHFEEVCYRAHIGPQEAIDKLTRSLERNV